MISNFITLGTSYPLNQYSDYLRAVYVNYPVAQADKWPPTPSKLYIQLALVKKERVSRAEANYFTHLTLQGDIDQILRMKEPIDEEDIFVAGDNTRSVVLEGAPGIGKSTFAWELCRKWASWELLNHFSLVVLLRLREEGVQTAKDLSDLLYRRNPSLRKSVGELVEQNEGKDVLLIFDGFDEFPVNLRRTSLVAQIIKGSYPPKASVLVTSRPFATVELQSIRPADSGKHIEVVGFSGHQIQQYAESNFGTRPDILSSFLTYYSLNPIVKAMMYNPLVCGIVLEVYRENYLSGRPIPHTQTQLYTELTLCLMSRQLSSNGNTSVHTLPDRLGDIPSDSDIYKQLMTISELALQGRVNETVIFKRLPGGCGGLGLLNNVSTLYGRKEDITYSFLHLTLQEYFTYLGFSQWNKASGSSH